MSLLLELTLKSSVLVAAGLLVARCLHRRSAALRHLVLAASVVGALVLPLSRSIAPGWTIPSRVLRTPTPLVAAPPLFVETDAVVVNLASTPPATDAPRWTWTMLAIAVWMSGASAAVLLLVVGLGRLWWLTFTGREITSPAWRACAGEIALRYGIRRPVRLLESDRASLLIAYGLWRPTVLLPVAAGTWGADRAAMVMAHELAHITRGDWPFQLAAELLRAWLWWHPLIWVAAHRLRAESEQACDDLVLSCGLDAADYAATLVGLARDLRPSPVFSLPAPAMARPSSLERRVAAMLNVHLNRFPLPRALRTRVVVTAVAATVIVSGFGVAAQSFSTVAGQTRDSYGGHVGGTTVTLSNKATGQKYEVPATSAGAFELVGVVAGDYVLTASRPGFKTASVPLTVAARNVRQDVTLDVGSLEETITVLGNGSGAMASSARPRVRTADAVVAPTACDPSAKGGVLKPPTKVFDVRPIYPPHLDMARVGDRVEFEATVAADGTVRDVRPVDARANADLAMAGADAIRQWVYTPTLLNCVPIDVSMRVHVSFRQAPPLPPLPPAPPAPPQ